MMEKILEVQAAYERMEMHHDLMVSIIESTQNFREGFYAMRMITDLSKMVNRPNLMQGATSPEEALDLLLQHLDNITATIQTQIERLER